ncbi:hypothetical protein OSTOST_20255, partial [Ostertagia ostertagi]
MATVCQIDDLPSDQRKLPGVCCRGALKRYSTLVVCLGDQGAVNLIKQAIKQVVDVHLPYGIKHFHIGADEAFRIAAWTIMFKSFPDSSIREHEIGDVVELVIWDYSESLITMP